LPAVSAGRQALPPGHDRHPGRWPGGSRAVLDAPPPPPGQGDRPPTPTRAREAL